MDFKVFPIRKYDSIIPESPHPGGFGVKRKFHIHEGVDLYCSENTPIIAMEDGIILDIFPFTGKFSGSPWWEETHCVMISGKSNVINYGEIRPVNSLHPGMKISKRSIIGYVKKVLKKDKGKPMSMLHLELYERGVKEPVEWKIGQRKPDFLLDPTSMLKKAKEH